MTPSLNIALAQLNPTIGDIAGNMRLVIKAWEEAKALGADLVVCPELVLSGYPPEDMVLRPAYAKACHDATLEVARATADGPGILLTSLWPDAENHQDPRPITSSPQIDPRPFNACVLMEGGELCAVQRKQCLPNYGVFDEPRTFRAGDGTDATPVLFRGVRLGLLVCEDMWYTEPAAALAAQGVDIFIAPHGSPFRLNAPGLREYEAQARVRETGAPLIFLNQVGGQDELVFDGGAFVMAADGRRHQAPRFTEGLVLTEWAQQDAGWQCVNSPNAQGADDLQLLYEAAMVGTRDYVRKSGFERVVLGLSGGIDSAMVAAIAVDALGAENVRCVMMPSRYTSPESLEDAAACAEALGVRYDTIGIEPGVEAFDAMLAPSFEGRGPDVTEENIQSRLRGVLLMALSNKFGSMVLTTGNKSEMAVGYATLYGDMNGGFNPLKDLYKTQVFALARWRNAQQPEGACGPSGEVIPERIITKPPSAELREDQKDEDSLPPYDVLDDILHGLVEEEASVADIAARGHTVEIVQRIQRLLYGAEYKRNQAPPGPKVSAKNFGRDRRYPIVNRWREER